MVQKILALVRGHIPLLAVIAVGLWFAHGNAFMQDDAYISYNYAKWFSRGYGLVWYPGSTEFGYTNFFYTFMIGVAMLLGVHPETASNSINVASFVGCLVLTYQLSLSLPIRGRVGAVSPEADGRRGMGASTGDGANNAPLLTSPLRWEGLIPILLLATHHSFTAYATGGLETMWVTFLILFFYWHILTQKINTLHLGTIAALALLSRLDTALLLFPGYVYLLLRHCEPRRSDSEGGRGNPWRIRLQQCVNCFVLLRNLRNDVWVAVLIPLITTLGFLLCCTLAYGYALPGSFYLKIPESDGMIRNGLRYLWLYNMLHFYMPMMVPLVITYFFARRESLQRLGSPVWLLISVVTLWLCYVVYVGGDFMEFRFLVPVLPFYYIVVLRLILTLLPKYHIRTVVAVTCAFLLGNALHPTLFKTKVGVMDFNDVPKRFDYVYVESTDTLNDWITVPKVNWSIIGKSFGTLFTGTDSNSVLLATGPAGVITYYSDMRTFDLLGLNSRSVLGDHKFLLPRAGHTMIATNQLLTKEKVALNVFTPQSICKRDKRYVWLDNPVRTHNFTRHQTLFVPLNNDCYVVVDYVRTHPKVEEWIGRNVILRYRDVAEITDCPAWLCLR